MAAFKALFHKKISLSVLPDEYYYPFKSFYRSLAVQSTFDMGAILKISDIAKKKSDFESHISNIITGFTVVLRKMEQNEEDLRKSKTDKAFKITPYSYAYVLAGMQFCMMNHQPPLRSDKCDHDQNDVEAASECKYCSIEYKDEQMSRIRQ